MTIEGLIERICAYADEKEAGDEFITTELEGVYVARSRSQTVLEPALYAPLLCLVLQGQKETHSGTQAVSYGAGESLIVGHELPVVSQVTEASPETPYVAITVRLDMGIIRGLFDVVSEADIQEEQARPLGVGETESALFGAIERLFELVERPVQAKIMLPMLLREIHFRLLLARHGAMLRQLLERGSYADRIARIINRVKQNLTRRYSVSELAKAAGMSASSFHGHFKAITGMTPLQYQKNLRLLSARVLLVRGDHTVAQVAYEVGYESPTQFSREYSRKFGVPPSADLNRAGDDTP